LRPKSAPTTLAPSEITESIFFAAYCSRAASMRCSARAFWSRSVASWGAKRARSFSTAASRDSRSASRRRTRNAPSLSPGLEVCAESAVAAPALVRYSCAASALRQRS
jgi:hypothetical protein